MIRIYSAQGPDVLRPYVINLGPFDHLAPDVNGGVLAVFHRANYGSLGLINSIPGVTVISSDNGVVVPAAALPLLAQFGVVSGDTIRIALRKIHQTTQLPHWDPDHAL